MSLGEAIGFGTLIFVLVLVVVVVIVLLATGHIHGLQGVYQQQHEVNEHLKRIEALLHR